MNDQLTEARVRMAGIAVKLADRFTPMEAANILAGVTYAVLAKFFGPETARNYFETLADEIDRVADGDDGETLQ